MASNYAAIREDNKREYGEGIGRWGRVVLADRYDNRAHFILELLQNAEDALARRRGWEGKREVSFDLSNDALAVSHFGKPFDEADVRGICGIAKSTKDLTEIGRFGIGFKSVYAVTDKPEIHSGEEDFAIEDYVLPMAIAPIGRSLDETVFVLPLSDKAPSIKDEITEGLRELGPETLLFLRHIDEIAWSVKGGPSGFYFRAASEKIDENVRRVTLIGAEEGKPEVEETWLVLSGEAKTSDGVLVGYVEIAFSTEEDEDGVWSILPVEASPLFAFFPTVLATGLGFLVQGPYRTTPSRDNVPANEPWNQHLVLETAKLLVHALRWFRDKDRIDIGLLECLPLDKNKFSAGSRFAPLFAKVREALLLHPLLPRFGGGYVSAKRARLARTQELRELLDPTQLGRLFDLENKLYWLTEEITQDRTPELRRYLIYELGVAELTAEGLLPKLNNAFLAPQADEWVLRLYEFLNGQPALLRQARRLDMPLIRLEDSSHVAPIIDGQPQAFLPGDIKTDFPTVRRSVCASEQARQCLILLGLTRPDPVDDVVRNILPKYQREEFAVPDQEYEADVGRIVTAFETDSKGQREKLLSALRDTCFVRAVDAGDGSKWVAKPRNVYLATERLKDLFAGVNEILLVDDSYTCLRGEDVRALLDACGASRYLQLIEAKEAFTRGELREMRRAAGCEMSTGAETIHDFSLRGLDELLSALPEFDTETRGLKARLLWEALGDVVERRGRSVFSGAYTWFYVSSRGCSFDAAFTRKLNEVRWVPDENGNLRQPEFILFSALGWEDNPFLLSKIQFKPPIIEALAKEAGFEPGVLDLLKKLGLTSLAELRVRLGETAVDSPSGSVSDAIRNLLGDAPDPTPPVPEPATAEPGGSGRGHGGNGGVRPGSGIGHSQSAAGPPGSGMAGRCEGDDRPGTRRTPGSAGGRNFMSYVGAHPEGDGSDPDGLDQQARMALEEKAMGFILARESHLQRTPTHNPGYDLVELAKDGRTVKWIEVKAMTGNFHDRPVGLSHAQFECAREHGEAYWLYAVEHAGSSGAERLVRIQDPAGKAKTFTFDRGWLDVAETDSDIDTAAE
jgi:hypothetical protein